MCVSVACIFGFKWACHLWPANMVPQTCQFRVEMEADAGFQVHVADEVWIRSVPFRFFVEGRWHSSTGQNASMKRVSTRRYSGSDALGNFSCVNMTWSVQLDPRRIIHLHTSFQTYLETCAVILVQEVPQGAQHTNASEAKMPKDGHQLEEGAHPPILSFPSFAVSEQLRNLGFLTWRGMFAKAVYGKGVVDHLAGLSSNGPVLLFNEQPLSLIVSPLDNFKNAVHSFTAEVNAWETGVSSEITSLPPGFRHRTLLMAAEGITHALDVYGNTVRKIFRTNRASEDSDNVINYLSYWTATFLSISKTVDFSCQPFFKFQKGCVYNFPIHQQNLIIFTSVT